MLTKIKVTARRHEGEAAHWRHSTNYYIYIKKKRLIFCLKIINFKSDVRRVFENVTLN